MKVTEWDVARRRDCGVGVRAQEFPSAEWTLNHVSPLLQGTVLKFAFKQCFGLTIIFLAVHNHV